jgi:cyclase
MLKTRIIASLILKNNIVVQSVAFKKYLPIGSPEIAVEFLNKWGIDEIILLDIDATREGRSFNIEMLKNIAKHSLVPITVGGGIKKPAEILNLIKNGADKVSLNSAVIKDISLIEKSSQIFGSQSLVVSIDVKKIKGVYEVFIDSGKTSTGIHPVDLALKSEKNGAGEILINSIDHDGMKLGYDLRLVQLVSEAVSIPVIALGGVGHPEDFLKGISEGKANAVAAGNFFHFIEHSPIITKSFISKSLGNIRINTQASYKDFAFDKQGRLTKRDNNYLNKIRFEHEFEEII